MWVYRVREVFRLMFKNNALFQQLGRFRSLYEGVGHLCSGFRQEEVFAVQ